MRILLLTIILNWNLLTTCVSGAETDKDWWQTAVVSSHFSIPPGAKLQ